MPPGPQKRKAPKKKNKAKANKKSTSSTAPLPIHGKSYGGQYNSPHPVLKAEKKEDNISGNESLTTDRTQRTAKEKQAKIEINKGSNSQKQHEKSLTCRSSNFNNKSHGKKKAAKIEPATVADYLAQPIESLTEMGTQTPPIVDPLKPIDQSLVELASQLNNITKIQQKNDLLVAESPVKQTVANENDSKNNQRSKENEVEKLGSLHEKASPKSKNNSLPDSKCQYCGRISKDGVNEPEGQPLPASGPRATEKTSWKNCCGIFDLFSGSIR